MKKKVFISAMEKNEPAVQALFQAVAKSGFEPNGHFWNLEEKEITKEIPCQEIENADVWVIFALGEIPKEATIGLCYAVLAARLHRKNRLPILFIGPERPLPALLSHAVFITPDKLPTKLATSSAIKKPWDDPGFRLCAHNQAGVGFWLEVGPSSGNWDGVLVATDNSLGGKTDFIAVGPKGALPERSELNYPIRDAQLEAAGKSFTGNGCKNAISENDSVFLRIKGVVPSILLCESLSDSDESECRIIDLI